MKPIFTRLAITACAVLLSGAMAQAMEAVPLPGTTPDPGVQKPAEAAATQAPAAEPAPKPAVTETKKTSVAKDAIRVPAQGVAPAPKKKTAAAPRRRPAPPPVIYDDEEDEIVTYYPAPRRYYYDPPVTRSYGFGVGIGYPYGARIYGW